MNPEFDGTCLFCGKKNVDIAHVSRCSFEDAKKKLVQKEDDITANALTRLFNAVLMIKTYEHAAPEDKALMYVCSACGTFAVAHKVPPICPSCRGLHTTMSSAKYIDDLMAS